MPSLVQIELSPRAPTNVPPVLRTGFRPFFLLAATWAALALPLWAFALNGSAPALPVSWHAHEMTFGFTFAVVAGFLLTAVRNWTGRDTARGPALLALACLWIGGRIAALANAAPLAVATFDGLLVFGVFVAIARPVVGSRNVRNAPFLVAVALWGVLDAVVHATPARASWALARELDLVVLLMVVVTGRILPTFTQNALPHVTVIRAPRTEAAALGLTLAMLVAGLVGNKPQVPGVLGMLAGAALLLRARGWQTRHTLGTPLLWILHLGHAWIAVGLVLRGLGTVTAFVPASLGIHALTAGAIGTLTLGMMTRVALGHTGRPLVPPTLAVVAYGLVSVAALTRLFGAIYPSVAAWSAAAILFSLAFASYVVSYAPMLVRSRVDGLRE
jgi:uncharacterized protein involved in response to NO